ncbi:hypothetical protein NXX68_21520 [Bacteroides fragilis]|nr:hypothetical protein [Bacteroides fragilis]
MQTITTGPDTPILYLNRSLNKDGYCSYEPMQDLIDAYWDVDGKTMRNDITMENVKNVMR